MIFMRPAFDSPCAPVERMSTLSSLIFADLFDGDDRAFFCFDEAERLRDLDVRLHRVAVQRDLAAELLGDLDDLRDAREERCECGDDDAAFGCS